MKKRLISCICLLCAAVLLLSSCTAGLPGSELFLTVKDSAGKFTAGIRNLLKKNTPIVIEQKSDYSIEYNVMESDLVKAAVADFASSIADVTDCTLEINPLTGSKKKILIATASSKTPESITAHLNAANFYIGLGEEGLSIYAANDIMLISALSYFQNTYLTGKKANAGKGYLYLPGDLNYFSETFLCNADSYTVIRDDDAGSRFVEPVTTFMETVKNTAGIRFSIDNDFLEIEDEQSAKEILIGTPKREQSNELLIDLSYNEYYIGIEGNKVMILARNTRMLDLAVDKFLSSFLTHTDAIVDSVNKNFTLPTYATYRFEEPALLLTQRDDNHAVLVYDNALGTTALNSINALAKLYKTLTTHELPVFSDVQRPENTDGKHEILVGATNRRESRLADAKLGAGEWSITTTPEVLCVATRGDNSTRLALDHLQTLLKEYALSYANESIYKNEEQNDYSIEFGPKRLLAIPLSLCETQACLPDPAEIDGFVTLREDSYMLYNNDCSSTAYTEYVAKFTEAKYTRHYAKETAQLLTAVYRNSIHTVTVNYVKAEEVLRVTVDPLKTSAIPPVQAKAYAGRTNITPTYTQLSNVYRQANIGMSHVLLLCDGTFVIINGGADSTTQANELMNYLNQNNPLSEKPIISCWIFTDGSLPSLGTFVRFFTLHSQNVQLKSILHNFPTASQTQGAYDGGNTANWYQNRVRYLIGYNIPVYRARTGVQYKFAGCNIEMLWTLEDYKQPNKLENFFDSSLAFRLTLSKYNGSNAKSILILGNISNATSELLLARYGNALKSDAVQVPASGFWGGSQALYDAISAAVVFWAVPYKSQSSNTPHFSSSSFSRTTRNMLSKEYAKVCYVACRGNVTLTLTQLNNSVNNGTVYGTGLTALAASSATN